MIATFFEWIVEPGQEAEFERRWAVITRQLHGHGSRGSTLFRREDGHYCALARWPDAATRDAAFAALVPAQPLGELVRETVQRFDLDELANLWLE